MRATQLAGYRVQGGCTLLRAPQAAGVSAYPLIMSEELDQALMRLSQVVDGLTRVPIDDFPARDTLMRERDALRAKLPNCAVTSIPILSDRLKS